MFQGMNHQFFTFSRAGNLDTNPTLFTQRAGVFSSSATIDGDAILLVRRNEHGMQSYLAATDRAVESSAPLNLAQTVGARVEACDTPEGLDAVEAIGHLAFRPSAAMRETQSGYDPGELPRVLAGTLPAGSWIAIVLRAPTDRERRKWNPWLAHRMNTPAPVHHSMISNATITTIWAGGSSRNEVASILRQVSSAFPGFDLDTKPVFPDRKAKSVRKIGRAAAVAVAGAVVPWALEAYAGIALPGLVAPLLFAIAALVGIPGILRLTGHLPNDESLLRSRIATGELPSPAVRKGRIRPPRKAETISKTRKGPDGASIPYTRNIQAFDGDYPLAPDAFLLGPNVYAGLVSPNAGAVSGELVTRQRATPPALLEAVGPYFGDVEEGRAYLPAATMLFGCAIVGRPGSGKSLTVRALYGWHCLERVAPSGRAGFPGRNNALVAFESKGDGVAKYQKWAKSTGDKLLVVDVADKRTPAIDLFAVPGDLHKKALFFTNAMQYTFGDTAIAHRSFDTLVQVLTAGLAVTDDLLESIEERNERALPLGKSPLWYAYVLLGGHADKDGVDLYNGIANAARKARDRGEPDENLNLAMDALSTLYDGKTESNRRTFQEAPRSKASQLLDLEDWWSPSRRKITWSQVLEGHRAIVINTGASSSGIILDDTQNQAISSLLMYSLKNAMMRHCSGWLEQNRFVTLFADELSLLAGSSPEIIGWLRDQGRSYGVRAILATQRPEQLPPLLRNNILTYAVLLSFTQTDVATAREVAENMGSGNGDWTVEDVLHTEPFNVIVRTDVDQRRQSAFTAKLPNFEADMPSYAALQGYPTAAGVIR